MKIVHISTSEKIGGAAIAANRLNEAFRKNNIDSKMLVITKTTSKESIITLLKGKDIFFYKIKEILIQKLKKTILNNSYFFTLGWFGCNIHKSKLLLEADAIYIHWTGFDFLSIKEISKILSLEKPIILFMHDMWFITGGCHHSFDCERYKSQCKSCPIIRNKFAKSLSSVTFFLKKKFLQNHNNLHIVTPSNWLSSCVKQSALFSSADINVIPNLIDTNLYKPLNKDEARRILNLPLNKKIILFGCNGGKTDEHKGWSLLLSALSYLDRKDIVILLFGGYLKEEEIYTINFPIFSMGYLFDEYSSVLLYNAADVFVTPSLAENFPNVLLESLSCGTYAVGFNVGGIPDLIQHKETGYLAKYKDVIDLANGINWVFNNLNEKSRNNLHEFVCENYSTNVIISKHKKMLEH